MNLHRRAKTCPESRELLVRRVREAAWPMGQAASALGISVRTGYKWLSRYDQGGLEGLLDRSSRPHRVRQRVDSELEKRIVDLRRQHRLPAVVLAERLGVARATLGRLLRRHGLSRARDLEPREPVLRYEREAPGDLVHLDIKKLGRIEGVGHRIHGDRAQRKRGIGWEYAHIAIDDFSRLAYVEILPDEKAESAAAFLQRSLAWFGEYQIHVQRLLTDNGSAYRSRQFAQVCAKNQLRHKRTRPYRPCTNGKAERFIQTALREWAYQTSYLSSDQRRQALSPWIHFYNHHRKHSALARLPPVSRLNNLVSTNS